MRGREKSARPLLTTAALFIAVMGLTPQVSFADEDGVSFWIPGTFGSLAAVPGEPGWSFATFNYYDNISAGADVAAAREITVRDLNPTLRLNLSASLHAYLDCVFVNPSYAFATPVLGGQLALSMGGFFGHEATGINGTLTAALGSSTRAVSQSFGDIRPCRHTRERTVLVYNGRTSSARHGVFARHSWVKDCIKSAGRCMNTARRALHSSPTISANSAT
jgi:hypothetical protein